MYFLGAGGVVGNKLSYHLRCILESGLTFSGKLVVSCHSLARNLPAGNILRNRGVCDQLYAYT